MCMCAEAASVHCRQPFPGQRCADQHVLPPGLQASIRIVHSSHLPPSHSQPPQGPHQNPPSPLARTPMASTLTPHNSRHSMCRRTSTHRHVIMQQPGTSPCNRRQSKQVMTLTMAWVQAQHCRLPQHKPCSIHSLRRRRSWRDRMHRRLSSRKVKGHSWLWPCSPPRNQVRLCCYYCCSAVLLSCVPIVACSC